METSMDDDQIAQKLGNQVIDGLPSVGWMAQVYQVRDLRFDRTVVI
jgi:hypothetical protein